MDFSGIIGQKRVVESLQRSLAENRVGHAYIFTGPAGMGKKTIARIYAGLLLCENPKHGSSCRKCTACLLDENGTNPDFHRITGDNSIGVDLIREMQEDVIIKPVYSKRKVYIIEDAGKMTEQAQNCLLKTLEEPPSYVVVILLADNYEMLLETIRSRAQRLNFTRYTSEEVIKAVTAKYGDNPELSRLAAEYSDGNIGKALELAGSSEFKQLREKVCELLAGALEGNAKILMDFSAFLEENRENIEIILEIIQLYFRDMLVAYETGNENMLINSDKKDMIINNARIYSSSRILSTIDTIWELKRALRQNANYQLVVDNLLIKLQEDNRW